jgi:GT2 family glycosyltransferase
VTHRAPSKGTHQAADFESTDTGERGVLPLASVIIVNTNERHHLERCLPSVCNQSYPAYDVIVVDNNSTDGSTEYISEHFPEVRLIQSRENLGYPGANNLGIEHATGEYIVILNPDTVVDHRWLEELVSALEGDPSAGLATSKILMLRDPQKINACGNDISLTGLTYCRGINNPSTGFTEPAYVSAVSGASFIIRRSVLDEIGIFDPEFVAYLEETDLSLRGHLAGHRSLYVPASIVKHDYAFRFTERKCFHIEKNRLYMLRKIFKTRTLILLSPMLLATEVLVWGYLVTQGPGHLRQKARSYQWLWQHREHIRTEHERTQQFRRTSDREVLGLLVPRLPVPQLVGGAAGRAISRVATSLISMWSRIPLRFAD